MIELRDRQRIIDDVLMLLMLCISGNPAFVSFEPIGKIASGLMLVILIIATQLKLKVRVLKQSAIWIGMLSVIFAAQYILLGEITVFGSLNFIVKMLCAILFASLLGDRLPDTLMRVMTWVCIVSLVFYAINLTGVRFTSPMDLKIKSECLIVYTQTWEDPLVKEPFRNSGMFWEPGAFAGYIIVTLLMFVDRLEVLWKKYLPGFIVLSVTLLTTFSTTGYITFFLLVLFYTIKWGINNNKRIIAYAVVAATIVAGVVAFNELDFLGEKIQRQYRSTENLKETDVSNNRFGSIVFDLPYIMSHPVFGNGLALSTRLRFHLGVYEIEDLDDFGNGFTGCIASMGLLFMLAYLIAIGMNRSLDAKLLFIFIIILLLQGEYFLNYPFFMLFPFIQLGPIKERTRKKKRIKFVWKKDPGVELQSS